MKVSVIMPSFLGEYAGAATDRLNKFHRAVGSFIAQSYKNKELIIISDGCVDTIREYSSRYTPYEQIKLICIPKQELFSGAVRDAGLKEATGDLISYLDADDYIEPDHISSIASGLSSDNYSWCYFNDYIKYFSLENLPIKERKVELHKGVAGTSCIAHRNLPTISWLGFNGYQHDWRFIENLMRTHPNYTKISGAKYVVCHIPDSVDV